MFEINGKEYHLLPKRVTSTCIDLDIYSREGTLLGSTKQSDKLGFTEAEDNIIEEEAKKTEVNIRFAETYGVGLNQLMTLPFKVSDMIDRVAIKCDMDYEFVCNYISSFQCYDKGAIDKAS